MRAKNWVPQLRRLLTLRRLLEPRLRLELRQRLELFGFGDDDDGGTGEDAIVDDGGTGEDAIVDGAGRRWRNAGRSLLLHRKPGREQGNLRRKEGSGKPGREQGNLRRKEGSEGRKLKKTGKRKGGCKLKEKRSRWRNAGRSILLHRKPGREQGNLRRK